MDRRDALAALAGALAGSALGLPRSVAATGRLQPVGLQLYTLRGLMADDFEGTLERVARIGYREVEFAGYFGRGPAEVRRALDRVGLSAPAAHVPLETVRNDWERTLEGARVMGHRYLVVPFLPAGERRSLDDYRRLAQLLDRAGEAARAAGIRFGYHNHDFEFERLEGRVPYDVLLEETDPELVLLELDLYWIRSGGGDPMEYFARHPGRFPLVHVKDMDAGGGMAPVGEGVIDFRRILARGRRAGIRHVFVEHDDPADPLASVRTSYEYLRVLEL